MEVGSHACVPSEVIVDHNARGTRWPRTHQNRQLRQPRKTQRTLSPPSETPSKARMASPSPVNASPNYSLRTWANSESSRARGSSIHSRFNRCVLVCTFCRAMRDRIPPLFKSAERICGEVQAPSNCRREYVGDDHNRDDCNQGSVLVLVKLSVRPFDSFSKTTTATTTTPALTSAGATSAFKSGSPVPVLTSMPGDGYPISQTLNTTNPGPVQWTAAQQGRPTLTGGVTGGRVSGQSPRVAVSGYTRSWSCVGVDVDCRQGHRRRSQGAMMRRRSRSMTVGRGGRTRRATRACDGRYRTLSRASIRMCGSNPRSRMYVLPIFSSLFISWLDVATVCSYSCRSQTSSLIQ